MEQKDLKEKVISLRKRGLTFSEISNKLKIKVAKSTLSNWCKNVELPAFYSKKVKEIVSTNIRHIQGLSVLANKKRHGEKLDKILEENKHLLLHLQDKNVARIILSVLYLCEGGKHKNSHLTFGNSDPSIIGLFLHLLRFCYNIDESRFRCTVQCRADQNTKKLDLFWSKQTKIPQKQFYKARIDPRTIGVPTKKKEYKGVCRINYFSADLFWQLLTIGDLIKAGP